MLKIIVDVFCIGCDSILICRGERGKGGGVGHETENKIEIDIKD